MKVIAIIGPFRGDTQWDIVQNIRMAETVALEVWRLGAVPLTPHLNTANFHGFLPDDVWLEGHLEVLRRCDAAMLVPGWLDSAGSKAEKREAERLGLPVFASGLALEVWLKGTEHGHRYQETR